MSTERQRESARINGARFRGPVTAEGKQISSRNSTRHGMLAQTVVLEGESKDRFQELLDGLIAEFQPGSTTETALVETMAIALSAHLEPSENPGTILKSPAKLRPVPSPSAPL